MRLTRVPGLPAVLKPGVSVFLCQAAFRSAVNALAKLSAGARRLGSGASMLLMRLSGRPDVLVAGEPLNVHSFFFAAVSVEAFDGPDGGARARDSWLRRLLEAMGLRWISHACFILSVSTDAFDFWDPRLASIGRPARLLRASLAIGLPRSSFQARFRLSVRADAADGLFGSATYEDAGKPARRGSWAMGKPSLACACALDMSRSDDA